MKRRDFLKGIGVLLGGLATKKVLELPQVEAEETEPEPIVEESEQETCVTTGLCFSGAVLTASKVMYS